MKTLYHKRHENQKIAFWYMDGCICPKCNKNDAKKIEEIDMKPLSWAPMKIWKCNSCNSDFKTMY